MPKESSIVLELQRLALDKDHDLTDLLRKALLVAKKLKIEDFGIWVENELGGYPNGEIPIYRRCKASVVGKDAYSERPLSSPSPEIHEALSAVSCRESVSSLICLLDDAKKNNRPIRLRFPPEIERDLTINQGNNDWIPYRMIPANQISTIIDTVRNTILKWSLKLEQEGILGEGISFSQQEKEKAAASTQIQIGNFQGILGNVNGSIVNQHLLMEVKEGDFESLRSFLLKNAVPVSDVDELEDAIKSDAKPTGKGTFGSKVSAWIGKMVQKAASGTWKVGIGIASNLLEKAIAAHYGFQ